ncbi:MAG TPA: hypothetical protein PKI03_24125 [Pseudomonadota bacterium]|nr:hypothetical protein [Pseudomonadota bacterium]
MPLPDGNPGWLLRPLTSLRPWAWAALLLLVCEGLLRLSLPPDPRVLRQPLRAQACYADDVLTALADLRAGEPAVAGERAPWDIVLLGDSVLGSVNNRAGQRLHDVLPAQLAGRGLAVRVHNLSAGGAHAGDQLGALLALRDRLAGQPRGLQRLLVVISTNPIFFSRRHSQPPLSFPCVFEDLDPAASPLSPDLQRRLGVSSPPPRWHRQLAAGLARGLYLYQQRRRAGELVFGEHATLSDFLRASLLRLRPGQTAGSVPVEQPWFSQGLSAERFRQSYALIPLTAPEALNAELTLQIASYLAAHRDLLTLVEQVPQNHHMMTQLASDASYRGLLEWTGTAFSSRGLRYRSHDGAPELGSEHFTDLDHLTAAGNQALARLLADDIVELVAQAAGSSGPLSH